MDIELYYQEKGSGEPLIMLHGNGEHGGYFKHQIACFSGRYRVMTIDTRGHGQSPRGEKPFTIRQFAEDLHDFMDEHQIEQAHILGFSDGGNIAMTFALKYPERVNRLILNGANMYPGGVKANVQIPIVLGYRAAKLLGRRKPEVQKKAELLGLMVHEPNIQPADLQKLQIPTLVIAGTHDLIREGHTKLMYRSLPNAQLAIINGGHGVARQNPEVFNRVVDTFLQH